MEIENVIPKNSNVVFLDYPLYMNIGDILIWKGAEAFFEKQAVRIIKRISVFGFPENLRFIENVDKETIIVLNGGGNFGDIYPVHQKFREKILSLFPGNKIVLLPQTAYFSNENELKKSAELFRLHNNVFMFSRDEKTFLMFKNFFSDKSYMSSDMAHYLSGSLPEKHYDQLTVSYSVNKILWLIRKDIEGGELSENVARYSDHFKDWDDFVRKEEIFFMKVLRKVLQLSNSNHLSDGVEYLWSRLTDRIISRIANEIIKYDYVVTSRLHGHIFSCLLHMRNLVLDNSYGKNSSYYLAWTFNVKEAQLMIENDDRLPFLIS